MTAATTTDPGLHELCERGSYQLAATDYIGAERVLEEAYLLALSQHDFDTLARLLYPLQEARRQKRQRCGEGVVQFDVVCREPDEALAWLSRHPHGQVLIRGWRSTAPAAAARRAAFERGMYVDVLLGADIPLAGGSVVTVVFPKPAELSPLPEHPTLDALLRRLPPHTVIPSATELPGGLRRGDAITFAAVMSLFERLHRPFLAAADSMPDSPAKLAAYNDVIAVDYACELAHQNAAEVARRLARTMGR